MAAMRRLWNTLPKAFTSSATLPVWRTGGNHVFPLARIGEVLGVAAYGGGFVASKLVEIGGTQFGTHDSST